MHSFESDYTAGARVEILRRLNETNLEQLPGYGSDKYCESAKEKIRAACDCPGADIFFMVGGTQTNAAPPENGSRTTTRSRTCCICATPTCSTASAARVYSIWYAAGI